MSKFQKSPQSVPVIWKKIYMFLSFKLDQFFYHLFFSLQKKKVNLNTLQKKLSKIEYDAEKKIGKK